MTRPTTTQGEAGPGCPPEVLDWIAWYPEGDLPEAVRGTIDAHAAQCAACREEIARMQGDAGPALSELPDPERVFARVRARIEELEEAPARGTGVGPAAGRAPARRTAADRDALRARPRPMWVATRRAAMAAALVLAVGAGFVGALIATAWDDSIYLTVRDDAGPAVLAEVVQLDVVFRPDASFGRIHDTLNEIGATVVAGPTPEGVMRLHLPSGSDPRIVSARLRAEETGVALFAEPVVR